MCAECLSRLDLVDEGTRIVSKFNIHLPVVIEVSLENLHLYLIASKYNRSITLKQTRC